MTEKTALETLVNASEWLHKVETTPQLLKAEDAPAKIAEVREAFKMLLEFRNLIWVAAEFDEKPRKAAQRFVDGG